MLRYLWKKINEDRHKFKFYVQGTNKSQQMKQNVKVLNTIVFNENL